MDKILNPFLIIRKPSIQGELKFSLVDNYNNRVMFQSLMRDKKDFASINLNTLERHYKYSYKFSEKRNGVWNDLQKVKYLIPEFQHENKVKYSYVSYENSKKLLVIFSSSASMENRYNYVNTLIDVHENKLFLADESLSDDKTKCSYFMGKNKELIFEDKIIEVIEKIADDKNISKKDICLIGSSKGGFASLYYAFKYNFGSCIVGSPTIQLGSQHKNNKFGLEVITHLTGDKKTSDIEWLDNLVYEQISNGNPKIYYHAGKGESRYINQALPFFNELRKRKKENFEIDLADYESHNDVIHHYPAYLTKSLKMNI